jgi:hypothetical protein
MQQINNQNPAIINEYPYYYYQFPPNMYGFPPPYFPQYIEPPKNLQENLNNIYQRGIVNNIIGAFYIKEYKEKIKNNEKRKVPISMVELGDEPENNNNVNNNKDNEDIDKKNDDKQSKLGNDGNNMPSGIENNDNEVNNLDNEKKDDNEEDDNNSEDNKEKEIENNNNHENELKKPDIIF